MNPKTPQDLDPKLKEAYDRVMGGSFTPPPAPSSQPPKMENPPPAPNPTANLTMPEQNPFASPVTPMPPISVMSPFVTTQNGQQTILTKKKSKISPVIFLVVGLAFFAVYAVVWAKIFKLF